MQVTIQLPNMEQLKTIASDEKVPLDVVIENTAKQASLKIETFLKKTKDNKELLT